MKSMNSELCVRRLGNILNLLASVFTERELEEVRNYIDLYAYDMALETIVNTIEVEKKDPPAEVFRLLYDLAKSMSFEKVRYMKFF